MTLDFKLPRRGSWLLWLLVFAAVGLLPVATFERAGLTSLALVLVRLLLIGVTLALVNGFWFGFGDTSPRLVRLAKEFRQQLPGTALAILVPAFFGSIPSEPINFLALPIYVIGCTVLGATTFGAEFEQRTMGLMLAQPLSRWVLLAEKLVVLASLLSLAFAHLTATMLVLALPRVDVAEWLSQIGVTIGLYMVPPLFAFCTGPCFALMTRRTLSAGVLVAAVPPTLMLMAMTACNAVFKLRYPDLPVPEPPPGFIGFLLIGGPVYFIAGLLGCGWRFRRWQWRDSAGAPVTAAEHPLGAPIDRLLRFAFGSSAITALVRKELRLHVGAWLVAMVTIALWIAWLVARKFGVEGGVQSGDVIIGIAIFLGGAILILSGAATIAEERELGTLDWQLTQPASLRRQWSIKIAVAFSLAVLLGVVLPAGLVRIGLGAEASTKGALEFLPLIIVALGFFPSAIYASSLCSSTVNAAVLSLLVGAVVASIPILPLKLITAVGSGHSQDLFLAPFWTSVILWGVLVTAVLITTAWTNLRRSALVGFEAARQLAAVAVGLIVLTIGLSGLAALSIIAQFEFLNTAAIDSQSVADTAVAVAANPAHEPRLRSAAILAAAASRQQKRSALDRVAPIHAAAARMAALQPAAPAVESDDLR